MKISRFGYFWLDTWILANVIQLATQDFFSRFTPQSKAKKKDTPLETLMCTPKVFCLTFGVHIISHLFSFSLVNASIL